MSQKHALKEAITEILSCALQPDSEIQRLTEERKKALEMTEDYPFILVELIESNEEAVAEKYMSAVFLKNYISDFYNSKHSQSMIRKNIHILPKLTPNLVNILNVEDIFIKSMICKALCYLVCIGYWPCMDSRIMSMLQNEDETQVFGAVLFLKTLCEQSSYSIPSEYFEALLNIFQKSFSTTTRASTIPAMMFIVKGMENQSNLLEDALNRLGQVFERTLKEPYSTMNDFQLKASIINGIREAFDFKDNMGSRIIVPCLPAVGLLMTDCCEEYKQLIREMNVTPRDAHEDENEPSHFYQLINSMLELVHALICCDDYFSLLWDGLDDLLYCLFVFIATQDSYSVFLEEDEKSTVSPIRINATNTLSNIFSRMTRNHRIFFHRLHTVLQKHLNEVGMQKDSSELYCVKILESLMYGMGILKDFFPENFYEKDGHPHPHSTYLEFWSGMLGNQNNLMIIGRLLWLCSRYSSSLSPSTLTVQIKNIIDNLNSANTYLYMPCTEALENHLSAYGKSSVENNMVIASHINDIAVSLFRASEKLISRPVPCLNAMGNLFKHFGDTAVTYIHNIQELLINVIYLHISNVAVMHEVNFLLKSVASNEACRNPLQSTLIPFIMKMIYKNPPEKLREMRDISEKGLDMFNTIVIYSPRPLDDVFIVEGFAGACSLILDKDNDNDVNAAAVNLLTTMLVKLSPRIKVLRNEKGALLTDCIPEIIFQLLDPALPDWNTKIGKLCVVSIMTLTENLENQMESILKSVLSSVQVNGSFEKVKGLLLIFAYILMYRPANTINFLSSIPGPTGGSALSYLLNKWKPKHVILTGKFEKIVLSMALTQILAFAVENNNDKLDEARVTLEQRNQDTCSGIEYLYFLLIQLLLMEVEMSMENGKDDSKEYEDEDELNDNYQSDKEEDHFLYKTFPFSNMNIISHIKSFLKNVNPYYYNVIRNILLYQEIDRLTSLGVMPEISME